MMNYLSSTNKPKKKTSIAYDNKGQINAHQIVSAHIDPLTREHCIEFTVVSVNKDRLSEMLIPDGFADLSLSDKQEDIEMTKIIYQDITRQTKDNPQTRALSTLYFSKAITFQYLYHPETHEIYHSSVEPSLARVAYTEYYFNAQKQLNNYSFGTAPQIKTLHDFARTQKQRVTGQDLSKYNMPVQEVMHQLGVLVQKTASDTAITHGIHCLHRTKMDDLPFIETMKASDQNITDIFSPITTTKYAEHSLTNLAFGVFLHEGHNIFTAEQSRALAIGASLSVEKKFPH